MQVSKQEISFMAEYILYSTYFNEGVTGRWPARITDLAKEMLYKIHGDRTDDFIEVMIYDKAMEDKQLDDNFLDLV